VELGDVAESEAGGQFVADVVLGVIEGLHAVFLLALGAADRYLYVAVAAVGTDVHFDYFHAEKTGIVGFEADDFDQLFPDRFGDA